MTVIPARLIRYRMVDWQEVSKYGGVPLTVLIVIGLVNNLFVKGGFQWVS